MMWFALRQWGWGGTGAGGGGGAGGDGAGEPSIGDMIMMTTTMIIMVITIKDRLRTCWLGPGGDRACQSRIGDDGN